jgi:hypothetical protein
MAMLLFCHLEFKRVKIIQFHEHHFTKPSDVAWLPKTALKRHGLSLHGIGTEFQKLTTAKIWLGVFNRDPFYKEVAGLSQNVFVFTGEMDVQTRPEEALRLQAECASQKKSNCEVTILPGLGHAMSLPKGPRRQKLID